MNRSQQITAFLVSFLLCIFCLQWWQRAQYPIWIWIVLGLLCSLFVYRSLFFVKKTQTKNKKRITNNYSHFFLAVCLGVLTSFIAVSRTTHIPTERSIDTYATKQYVTIEGTVAAEPDRRPLQTKYTIAAKSLTNGSSTTIPIEGNVLITDRRQFPEFQYGDAVVVKGVLEKPGQIEDFFYDRYLSRFDIYNVIYRASIQPKNLKPTNLKHKTLLGWLFYTKQSFESQINRLYPEPHASFMAGLLTGSRRGIPEKLMQQFNITGLTHIIAISGYNITIVITIILGLLFWLPFRWRLVPAVLAIVAFTLFAGASAAVVRAAAMGILGLIALHTGRQNQARLAVLWTLFFMLMYNPKYLWYDAGFQLSFLAVIGLMELSPFLDRYAKALPETLGIRESAQMTMAAQLSAVPWIVFLFGRFSLIAPVANILVAPFIPLAMLFGFLGTILSYVWFPLGQLLSYLGWGCLEWIVWVADLCSRIPYASIDLPKIGMSLVAAYYLTVLILLLRLQSSRH